MKRSIIVLLVSALLLFSLSGSALAIIDKIEAPKAGEDFDHAVDIEDCGYYFIDHDLPTIQSSLFEQACMGYYRFTPYESGEYAFYGKCIVGYQDQLRVRVYDKYQEQVVGTKEQGHDTKEALYTVELTAGYPYYIAYWIYSFDPEEIKGDLAICTPTRHAVPVDSGEKCPVCGRVAAESGIQIPTPTLAPKPTQLPETQNSTFDSSNSSKQSTAFDDITVEFYAFDDNESFVPSCDMYAFLSGCDQEIHDLHTSWCDTMYDAIAAMYPSNGKNGYILKEADEGKTFYVTAAGTIRIVLPDKPEIAGKQTISFKVGDDRVTMNIELEYMGDYRNDLGWNCSYLGYTVD